MSSPPPASTVTDEPLRVAVCAEDADTRDWVAGVLTAGGHEVCSREESGGELVAACGGLSPRCVVIAAERPDRATVAAVRLVRSELEGVPAVLVTRSARRSEVGRALELGIDGVVLEAEAEAALAVVVAVVCAGQVSVPSGQRERVRPQALTTRERQVLALVIRGSTNAQIASKLYLAESTVKSHLSSAFGKLGVSSRHEAATLILDPDRGRGLGIPTVLPGRGAAREPGDGPARELQSTPR